MGVEGCADAIAIIEAVENAGYGASLKGLTGGTGGIVQAVSTQQNMGANGGAPAMTEDALADRETPALKKRLFASLGFLIVLMYFSMGHMMWGWPVPVWFEGNHLAQGLLQLVLSAVIMVINQKFFVSGFKSLLHRAPNMDTLVALGSAASFGYSLVVLFLMTEAQLNNNMRAVHEYMMEFYFESAAMILTLITVGKMLEARAKGKTTDALKSLMKLSPETAVVVRDGEEKRVPVGQVRKGDIFVVRPGENIPVDGVVLEGTSAVNEATLTGESIPVDKEEGDEVSAATINQSGFLRCEATRVGEETTLSQIIKMVSDAAATKAPIAKIADRVSGVFVPVVMGIAAVTIIGWIAAGYDLGFALARGISVLVISCPCALGLATPVAVMVGNGIGAKNGVLFKTAASLEETGKVKVVALDKTGTITKGEPKVTDVVPADGFTAETLLETALALEAKSEHPLAKAVIQRAAGQCLQQADGPNPQKAAAQCLQITDFRALPGSGLCGKLGEEELFGGSMKFIREQTAIPDGMKKLAEDMAEQGKTPLFFTRDGSLCGIIAVADVIKEDSAQAIKALRNMGLRVIMLTGDNEKTARAIGEQAGVDEVIADVMPGGKEEAIRMLKQQGKIAMVGDGINDGPALTRADIGIAVGAGADVAIDAADVVLMKSRLTDVAAAIRLSRATLINIHQNLFWAFIYNIIGIPLAAGVWINAFGWQLNPMFGAAAMSLSSFCVVSNALRLNLTDVYDCRKDKDRNKKTEERKELKKMTKTMKIEGMMCMHCEAHVKKALEAMAEVESAEVSHQEGTAVVTLAQPVSDDALKQVVEEDGYTVLSIQ
ncbi:MAG: heavy metal translocating P-type ATPase [Firmicutes bacterium]|nr:heavy metal translocating P-type ATPase [Bacillota bacterium]